MKKRTSFIQLTKILSVLLMTCIIAVLLISLQMILRANKASASALVLEPVKKEEAVYTELKQESHTIEKIGYVMAVNDEIIELIDLVTNQLMHCEVNKILHINDANGSPMPVSILKKGDLIKIDYDISKKEVMNLSKPEGNWTKTGIVSENLKVLSQRVSLGEKTYFFTKETLVLNSEDEKISVSQIKDYDELEVKGIKDTVYSIKILAAHASIAIGTLPSDQGTVEIDRNRLFNLQKLKEAVPVKPGKHKVVINMEGYETIVEEVIVASGEIAVINPKSPREAFTEITVQMMKEITRYTIEIDGTVYGPSDNIKIRQGRRHIIVKADGYKTWEEDVTFSEPSIKLNVILESLLPKKSEEKKDKESSGEEQTSKPGETTTEEDLVGESVNLISNPSGAKVFIDGKYKGTTPYMTYLPKGKYAVILQKDGYEYYTTSIKISDSAKTKNNNNYTYVLTPQMPSRTSDTLSSLLGGFLEY